MYDAMLAQSRKIGTFGHGNTYAGHPVAAAVANKTLEIYERDNILAHVNSLIPAFQRRLRALAEHPLVGEARGVGFIGALELVKDKATRQRFDPLGEVGTLCRDFCFQNGLVMRAVWDTMIMSPPLVMSRSEIDRFIELARRCLDLTADALARR